MDDYHWMRVLRVMTHHRLDGLCGLAKQPTIAEVMARDPTKVFQDSLFEPAKYIREHAVEYRWEVGPFLTPDQYQRIKDVELLTNGTRRYPYLTDEEAIEYAKRDTALMFAKLPIARAVEYRMRYHRGA